MKTKLTREDFAIDVSGYADHITDSNEIIADLFAGAPSLVNLMPDTGNKAGDTVQMNILTTDNYWQVGNCVTTFSGDTVITPRSSSMVRISERQTICLDVLDAKLPQLQSIGARNEDLSFAQTFMDLKIAKNSVDLEKLAWRGSITGGTDNLSVQDGWLEIADSETSALGYYSTYTAVSSTNIITLVREMLDNRPEAIVEEQNILHMSSTLFGFLATAIVDSYGIAGTGLYVNAGEASTHDMLFPGYSNVIIRSTPGIAGNKSMYLTQESNRRYLVDGEHDTEMVEMFFDKVGKQFISDVVFTVAFNVEFPQKVCYMKFV